MAKSDAMGQFKAEHHTKKMKPLGATGAKYTEGMDNAGKLEESVDKLNSYVSKHKAKH